MKNSYGGIDNNASSFYNKNTSTSENRESGVVNQMGGEMSFNPSGLGNIKEA